MSQKRKYKSLLGSLLQLVVFVVVVSTTGSLHSALPAIAALSAFGLFHLWKAFREASVLQSNCHLWFVLASIFGSLSLFLLIDRLMHHHDKWGHLGWLFLPFYYAALVRAYHARLSLKMKPKLPEAQ